MSLTWLATCGCRAMIAKTEKWSGRRWPSSKTGLRPDCHPGETGHALDRVSSIREAGHRVRRQTGSHPRNDVRRAQGGQGLELYRTKDEGRQAAAPAWPVIAGYAAEAQGTAGT